MLTLDHSYYTYPEIRDVKTTENNVCEIYWIAGHRMTEMAKNSQGIGLKILSLIYYIYILNNYKFVAMQLGCVIEVACSCKLLALRTKVVLCSMLELFVYLEVTFSQYFCHKKINLSIRYV